MQIDLSPFIDTLTHAAVPALLLLLLAIACGLVRRTRASGRLARKQIRALRGVDLRATKPVNAEAHRFVFQPLDDLLRTRFPAYRLFAEVGMGGFIATSSKDRDAHGAYNAKRVDFLVVDPGGHPALAVEYHGTGHYNGDAVHRDKVKREALRRAGIPLVEIAAKAPAHEVVEVCAAALIRPSDN